MSANESVLKDAKVAFEKVRLEAKEWPSFRHGFLAARGVEDAAERELPVVKAVLLSRKEVEELTGRTPYAIKKAVEEGALLTYNGPLATKGAMYYSLDVIEWMKHDENESTA